MKSKKIHFIECVYPEDEWVNYTKVPNCYNRINLFENKFLKTISEYKGTCKPREKFTY